MLVESSLPLESPDLTRVVADALFEFVSCGVLLGFLELSFKQPVGFIRRQHHRDLPCVRRLFSVSWPRQKLARLTYSLGVEGYTKQK
jgi:hypothetical protein